MQVKTRRVMIRTLELIGKTLAIAVVFFAYNGLLSWLSIKLFGDFNIFFIFCGCSVPCIVYGLWEMAQRQVSVEMLQEEQLVETLSRSYTDQGYNSRPNGNAATSGSSFSSRI